MKEITLDFDGDLNLLKGTTINFLVTKDYIEVYGEKKMDTSDELRRDSKNDDA